MSSLSDFLLARISEDEADAMVGWRWKALPSGEYDRLQTRTLADCDAKRRIVELYRSEADITARTPVSGPKTPQEARSGALGEACLFLALPYASHPDYRAEWKP